MIELSGNGLSGHMLRFKLQLGARGFWWFFVRCIKVNMNVNPEQESYRILALTLTHLLTYYITVILELKTT